MNLKQVDKIPKKYQALCIYLLLALVTIAVFWQVGSCDFISYDDLDYVRNNDRVNTGLSWENVIWAFTKSHASNWHPLTWVSHMLDCQLFGLDPGGHHLTNLLLHLANTLLLFAVLSRMTGAVWRSVFVAAAFALHPLHIESVAWVSERKDVLSTLFWILTMGAYLGYVNRPNKGRYVLTLLVFGLGLMAKPMLVTLPLVLLLLDYWPLGRFQKTSHHVDTGRTQKAIFGHLFLEKIPLLALSAGSCAITFFAQQKGGAVMATNMIPIDLRIANAIISYAKYIGKMIWPSRLAVIYPHPFGALVTWQTVLTTVLLLAISVWVICLAKKRGYFAVGWFWYIITLLPVIGIVQVGSQAMADRYTYIPLTGLFIIIAWAGAELTTKLPYRKILLAVLSVTVLLAMAITSRLQLRHWRNSVAIFEHALEVTENNNIAHGYLVRPLFKQGRVDEAIAHNYQALRINPNDYVGHINLGFILSKSGKFDQAVEYYTRAIQIGPDYPAAYIDLGTVLMKQGKIAEAIEQYQQVLRLTPDNAKVYNDMGIALSRQDKLDSAVAYFNKALQIDPEFAKAHCNLGYALTRQGKFDKAVEHYTRAIQITPEVPVIYKHLADVLIQQGKIAEAIEQYQQVLRLRPDNAQVYNDMGIVFSRQDKLDSAVAYFNKALQINPEYAQAHYNLGYTLGLQGKFDEAVIHLKNTIELDPNYVPVYQVLGQILSQQGRMNEVVKNFKQGLRVQPDGVEMMNALAWMLAVHKSADFHDPNEAIGLAKRACELSGYEQPAVLDTLACAYAASGRFSEAVATTKKALELARSKEQDQQLIESLQNNLNLFQAGQAYYED